LEPSWSKRKDVTKLTVAFGSFSKAPKTAIIALYIFNGLIFLLETQSILTNLIVAIF
jgi:hypothetical protein